MGFYHALWGVFSFSLVLGTAGGKKDRQMVFGSLTILFALLALANFTGSHTIHTFAGYEGIVCGAFALNEAAAVLLNEKFGRHVLPM